MDARAIELHHHKTTTEHTLNLECASHLVYGLHPQRRKIIATRLCSLLKEMEKRGLVYDAIAVRGLSGFLLAPIVAMRLNKTLLVVRKGESCHSGRTVEGDYGARFYIILDDFISSGGTVDATVTAIATDVPLAQCVGMIYYLHMEGNEWNEHDHEKRVSRHFYAVGELGGYAKILRGQAQRVVDKTAERNSGALGSLAARERDRRLTDQYAGLLRYIK